MEPAELSKLAEIEERHWWFRERRHLIARAVRDIEPTCALDIGAAAGGNTRLLEGNGWSATALEYEPGTAQLAREAGLDVVRGDARRLPFPDDHFGLAVAYDVLEHIVEDRAVVGEMARVVRPGGTVLVAVPADPKLWSAHDDAVAHVRRYTRPELVDLFDNDAFRIRRVRSWNVLMRPALALKRRSSTGSDIEEVSSPLNAVLHTVIRLERYLPVGRLPGVSLLLEAQVV